MQLGLLKDFAKVGQLPGSCGFQRVSQNYLVSVRFSHRHLAATLNLQMLFGYLNLRTDALKISLSVIQLLKDESLKWFDGF